MPACAVASRTPAMAGMAGTCCGARGETAIGRKVLRVRARTGAVRPAWRSRRAIPARACANSSILLLGRRRRALGVGALDLRTLAELGNGLGLGPAHHVGLDLVLDLLERRNRAVALVLDLDHVPAELRLDRIRQLALVELERGLGELRHHLILGEVAEIAAFG